MNIKTHTTDKFNFLQPCFLQQLKKQCSARSKPSKSILQALKHSQTLNKELKIKNDNLRSQLEQSRQEIILLKAMLQNEKLQFSTFKKTRDDRIKLQQSETHLKIQIEMLRNQNILLKRQRADLHVNSQQDQSIDYRLNSQDIIISPSKLKGEHSSIHETAKFKFNDYVNFNDDDIKNGNKSTQVNSKYQIEINGPSSNHQSKQLMKMLSLAHSNHDLQTHDDHHHYDQCKENNNPRIKQIVSQNQFTVDDQHSHVIGHLIRHKQQCQHEDQPLLITFKGNKVVQQNQQVSKQYTSVNLITKKSIDDRLLIKQPRQYNQSIKILLNQQENFPIDSEKDILNIQNISNCDYYGFLNDIQEGNVEDEEIPPFLDPSELQQPHQQEGKKKPISFKNFNIKETVSLQVQSNQKIQPKTKNYLKKKQPVRASRLKPEIPNDVKVSFSQNRYKNNTQSYKTIDLDKIQTAREALLASHSQASSFIKDDGKNDASILIVLTDPKKSPKSKEKLKKNQQLSSSRSQCSNTTNKMSNSRVLSHEKYLLFNNRRGNIKKIDNLNKFQATHNSDVLSFTQNGKQFKTENISRSQIGFKQILNNNQTNYQHQMRDHMVSTPKLRKKSSSSNNLFESLNRDCALDDQQIDQFIDTQYH